jgi:hypothetical protein
MFLHYDLAKAILDDRRAEAAAHSRRRRARMETRLPPRRSAREEAEVIELVFGKQCESGQIGA